MYIPVDRCLLKKLTRQRWNQAESEDNEKIEDADSEFIHYKIISQGINLNITERQM